MRYIFIGSNDKSLYNAFKESVLKSNIQAQVRETIISGLYTHKNIVKILPDNVIYTNIKISDVDNIVEQHLIGEKIVEDLVFKNENKPYLNNEAFYHKQLRVELRNCGVINPENIDDYILRNGYKSLVKVLIELNDEAVINELKISGLRGRGGGGFPTWMKWDYTRKTKSDIKYIVCNADEGDPGAYMNRSALEGDPHSILEGMAIAGKVVGANIGYIYCRAEYPLVIERLNKAIDAARTYGLLGENILGTGFNFDIEIRLGAGAFVCGEETALLASIEGKRGMPRPRPPFPAVKGLWNKPTVINNVGTFANIPAILYKGGAWYSSIGNQDSKGTKVFALTGKVKFCGLIEVPMGTTLREVIFDIGGGMSKTHTFKAVQTGGPSGGVIPYKHIDTEISYANLTALGSIMGSGGMIVMDTSDCMVDVSKFYLQFSVDESCGKCAPCRIGTKHMLSLLEDITNGNADASTLVKIKSVAKAMQKASLCGLGQTAANPVVSTMQYFDYEYEEHVFDKKCRTGVCKNLVKYSVVEEKCVGCTLCARICPVNCISGGPKLKHKIDEVKCIKCGQCYEVCKFNAIDRN